MQLVLTPALILDAYRHGLFPMAYSGESAHINWVCPEMRGQLSIPDLHIPRSLLKTLRRGPYEVCVNRDFAGVITECAVTDDSRPETWINDSIRSVFVDLHQHGHAHSVECWQDGDLVGGLYGLAIGGAFFGESMFSRARDASKIALVHLAARLWRGGFSLLDTQFTNDHLEQFGVYEVAHEEYVVQLNAAVKIESDFALEGLGEQEILAEYLAGRGGG